MKNDYTVETAYLDEFGFVTNLNFIDAELPDLVQEQSICLEPYQILTDDEAQAMIANRKEYIRDGNESRLELIHALPTALEDFSPALLEEIETILVKHWEK